MKNVFYPYGQAGLEGARWLRDEAELGGTLKEHLKHGSVKEAGLLAVKNSLQHTPQFDIRQSGRRLIDSNLGVIGIGSEALVIWDGTDGVHKYMTGKTQKPDLLSSRLKDLHIRARKHLGDYLPETEVTTEEIKLFKGTSAHEYVRLDQPFIDIKYTDPQLDSDILANRPEIAVAIADFSDHLVDLFEEEGLLMDIVNKGNLVWGSVGDGEDQLLLLDTVPIEYSEPDFTGINVPFWSPDMHLEYLADFVEAAHPDEIYFTDSKIE